MTDFHYIVAEEAARLAELEEGTIRQWIFDRKVRHEIRADGRLTCHRGDVLDRIKRMREQVGRQHPALPGS